MKIKPVVVKVWCDECLGRGTLLTGKRGRPPKCAACFGNGYTARQFYREVTKQTAADAEAAKQKEEEARKKKAGAGFTWEEVFGGGQRSTPPPGGTYSYTGGQRTRPQTPPPRQPPPKAPTYYDVLGVSPTASADAIKTAYRGAARKHHPDFGGDAEMMKKVNLAYEVLSDEIKRRSYNFDMGIR